MFQGEGFDVMKSGDTFSVLSLLLIMKFMFQGEGFDVMKSGDARVALIGFPSVGKVSRKLTAY